MAGKPTMTIKQTSDDIDDEERESRELLEPVRKLKRRAVIWVALCLLGLIGTAAPGPKIAFCLSMGLIFGSFPQASVDAAALHWELFVFFLRVQKKRWKFSRFIGIEIDLEDRPFDSMANVFKVGELLNKIWALFDACVPWLGGDYKIYLRAASGKRVLAWQGSNDEQFHANLNLLVRVTGLKGYRR